MTKLNESVKRLYRKKGTMVCILICPLPRKKEIPSTNNLSMLVTSLGAIHRKKEEALFRMPSCGKRNEFSEIFVALSQWI